MKGFLTIQITIGVLLVGLVPVFVDAANASTTTPLVMVLLSEYNGLIGTSGIKAAYSDDGLNFTIPVPIAQRRYFLSGGGGRNHNPGFIGDRMGRGFLDMYITYGISETEVNKYEYTVRQLGYSSIHITPK